MSLGCDCCRDGNHSRQLDVALSRRRTLTIGTVAAVASLAGAGGEMRPKPAVAQTTVSPDAALKMLLDGNARFVAKQMTSFAEDLTLLKQNTAEKQEPFAAVLSCADSRVPVELVFDQSIGHVFVTRVAGNVANSAIIASLEYGAAVLGTRAIVVLGHGSCGAVKATMDGKAAPGQISQLYAYIRPAVDTAGGSLDTAIRNNARMQAKLLATASPVLAGLIKDGKLRIVAAHYDLASGKVDLLGDA